ncbi:alpha/beta hydrolase family protein [Oceanobacter mangrovi]|uniref:alpha/beta hydrolase family protein n=1 Tax=Oceanobacter mangrovi TaxID=2862510 RepID=UPI001C8DAC4C|nr:prolyl oligopeptidase family serine peptidase [Oceanobacter mangrovi]
MNATSSPVHKDSLRAAQQGKQWAELRTAGNWLGWLEFDPLLASNRICLANLNRPDLFEYPLPQFSSRSRVHEYGGGSWCLWSGSAHQETAAGLAFVNEKDQRIYWLELTDDGDVSQLPEPVCLWWAPHCRYGDLIFDPVFQRIVAVEEDHSGVEQGTAKEAVNRLVAIALTGERSVLAEGCDFYSSPALDSTSSQLAWLSWNHPWQPWLATSLTLASLDDTGGVADISWQFNAELDDISCVQPGFDSADRLVWVSDHLSPTAGMDQAESSWNLYRYHSISADSAAEVESLCPSDAEFAAAQWQLGGRHWACLPGNTLVAAFTQQGQAGFGQLFEQGIQTLTQGISDAARYHSVVANHQRLQCFTMVESQLGGPMIASWQQMDYGLQASASCLFRLQPGAEELVETSIAISRPQLLTIPLPDSMATAAVQQLYGWFYPAVAAAADKRLIIQLHGGPTAFADSSFDAQRQFWCDQGFAVLVLNYRGSSGFGRSYRHALQRRWGITDIEDVFVACDFICQQGLANHGQIFVRGNSAGGYSVLQVLAQAEAAQHGIAGGASLYGISDLLLLNQFTHKFESHYLHWLIGDAATEQDIYRQRSPIEQLDSFQLPVIFFQGSLDKVVPPAQTRDIFDALQHRGIESEYQLFEGEGHGFRKAANRALLLERELAFYQRLVRSDVIV